MLWPLIARFALRAVGGVLTFLVAFFLFQALLGEFGLKPIDFEAPPTYPTRSEAVNEALREMGRAWPGSHVTTATVGPGQVIVERKWLGMLEERLQIRAHGDGWMISEGWGEAGAGAHGQELVVVFAALVPAWALLRVTRRNTPTDLDLTR